MTDNLRFSIAEAKRSAIAHVEKSKDAWLFVAGVPLNSEIYSLARATTQEQHRTKLDRISADVKRVLTRPQLTSLSHSTYRMPRRWGSGYNVYETPGENAQLLLERGDDAAFLVGVSATNSAFRPYGIAHLAALVGATSRTFGHSEYQLAIFGSVPADATVTVEFSDEHGAPQSSRSISTFEEYDFAVTEGIDERRLAAELASQWGLTGEPLASQFLDSVAV